MELSSQYTLIRLSDTDLTLSDPAQDVRGRGVLDSNREEIGHVDDLFIDDREKKVRFLRVVGGGFLGIGGKRFLVPVDAITRIDADHVHIDRTRQHVADSPVYDPALEPDHFADAVYAHYGYLPFWGAGYIYPTYPFYV